MINLLVALIFARSIGAPGNVTAASIVHNDSIAVTLAWQPALDESRLQGYEIYRSRYSRLAVLTQDTLYVDRDIDIGREFIYDIVRREKKPLKPRINKETGRLSWRVPPQYRHFTGIQITKDGAVIGLLPISESEYQDNMFSPGSKYEIAAIKSVSIFHEISSGATADPASNIIKWKRPTDYYLSDQYEIWRAGKEGEYDLIGSVKPGINQYPDTTIKDGVRYYYKIAGVKDNTRLFSEPSAPLYTIGTPKCLLAVDIPNDEGGGFRITWEPSPNAQDIKTCLLMRLAYDSLAGYQDTFIHVDSTGIAGVDYRYLVVRSYEIRMSPRIIADSAGLTGRAIRIEWKINPKVIGQKYDLTLIYRAEKDSADNFKYIDYTSPSAHEFIDGTAEPGKEYIYEARAVKERYHAFRVSDTRTEDGKHYATVSWKPSREPPEFLGYIVQRADRENGTYGVYARLDAQVYRFQDRIGIYNHVPYAYRLVALTRNDERIFSETTPYVLASPQWFHAARSNTLIALLIFICIVLVFMQAAKSGKTLFVRRIAGLSAIDEAVGRATEMGRPILYVPGTSTIEDVATIASLNILGEVAKKTAHYNTPLIVPNRDPIVFTVAREIVKESYDKMGRPDAYNPDSVYFITDSQFAFAAAVDGIMLRQQPATNFLVGMFWAESLIMAETGASTGAIQIAGTDAVTQLPFFITACDYTLIGEELYAASAYISKNPSLLAALKSQDYTKMIIVIVTVTATILALLRIGIPVFNLFNVQ